jgi:hypothetical protein
MTSDELEIDPELREAFGLDHRYRGLGIALLVYLLVLFSPFLFIDRYSLCFVPLFLLTCILPILFISARHLAREERARFLNLVKQEFQGDYQVLVEGRTLHFSPSSGSGVQFSFSCVRVTGYETGIVIISWAMVMLSVILIFLGHLIAPFEGGVDRNILTTRFREEYEPLIAGFRKYKGRYTKFGLDAIKPDSQQHIREGDSFSLELASERKDEEDLKNIRKILAYLQGLERGELKPEDDLGRPEKKEGEEEEEGPPAFGDFLVCPHCDEANMFYQELEGEDVEEVEFSCPACGGMFREKIEGISLEILDQR